MNSIKFVTSKIPEYGEYVFDIVPEIDGRNLVDSIAAVERAAGESKTGTHGGLIPSWFRYGPLVDYYLGNGEPNGLHIDGKPAILGCDCGEVGCRPFYVRITVSRNAVTWSEFGTLGDRSEIFSGFGPFQFDRVAYEKAIVEALETIERENAIPPELPLDSQESADSAGVLNAPTKGIDGRGKRHLARFFKRDRT